MITIKLLLIIFKLVNSRATMWQVVKHFGMSGVGILGMIADSTVLGGTLSVKPLIHRLSTAPVPWDNTAVDRSAITDFLGRRLRKRSVFVKKLMESCGLEDGVFGKLYRGRWTPDLPTLEQGRAFRLLCTLIEDGAKLKGVGNAISLSTGKPDVGYATIELDGIEVALIPSLYAKLVAYSCFRDRTPEHLQVLRQKCLEWQKVADLDKMEFAALMPGTLALAMAPTSAERLGNRLLSRITKGVSTFSRF
jgi:hypothetical protein